MAASQPNRPAPQYRTLLLVIDRGVATVTLNRPSRRNAFGGGMREELADAFRRCDSDDAVRAIVLTGTPPAFCAGADLSEGEQTFAEPGPAFSAAGIDVPAWSLSKPVIAAVNGHAIGLGLTLALQCDIRFFAADARYGVVQVRRGVVGDAYSHWILPRLVGPANAAEILLTGTTFDGHRAVQLGLGSRVLDAADVLPAALEMARDIAVNTAPMSVAASKRLLWDSFDLGRDAVGARETAIHLAIMGHDDAKEGERAHLAGRPPQWTGAPRDPTGEATSTPALRKSSRALAVESGATPAVRSSRTRVVKPASAASTAVARTQKSVATPAMSTASTPRSRSQSASAVPESSVPSKPL